MYVCIYIYILLLYSIGFRLQFVSPNLEPFFVFNVFNVLFFSFSFISCMFGVPFLFSFQFPFAFLPCLFHCSSISHSFPFHFPLLSPSFTFQILFISFHCVFKVHFQKSTGAGENIIEILIRARDVEGKQVNKNSLETDTNHCQLRFGVFFWFIDTKIRTIQRLYVINCNSNCMFLSYMSKSFSYCICTRHLTIGIF